MQKKATTRIKALKKSGGHNAGASREDVLLEVHNTRAITDC
jgi:hypothetical protein